MKLVMQSECAVQRCGFEKRGVVSWNSIDQLTNPQLGDPGVSRVTRNKVQSSNFRMANDAT